MELGEFYQFFQVQEYGRGAWKMCIRDRKVHVHVIAKQESQKPCNCADEGFNNEIFLDSGQGFGKFADACVAVMPQFIDVRPEAGGFPQEERHQDQNQGRCV